MTLPQRPDGRPHSQMSTRPGSVPPRPDLRQPGRRTPTRAGSVLIVLGLLLAMAAGVVVLDRSRVPGERAADGNADRSAPNDPPRATPVEPGDGQGDAPGDGKDRPEPEPDTPAGPATYRFLQRSPGQGAWRFDPCEEIAFVANLSNAPHGAVADLREAVRRVERATGLRFRYEGATDEVARPSRKIYQPARYGDRWAPLLVDWQDPDESRFVWRARSSGAPALGLATPLWSRDDPGIYVSGVVVLNAIDRGPGGFGWPWSRGVTILHELGHVVGLAHVHAKDQVMTTDGTSNATAWGAGDLAGLELLGERAGCLPPVLPP
ncbi:MAG: hypothetical protein WEA10_08520 [Actinomycetota bacterium]